PRDQQRPRSVHEVRPRHRRRSGRPFLCPGFRESDVDPERCHLCPRERAHAAPLHQHGDVVAAERLLQLAARADARGPDAAGAPRPPAALTLRAPPRLSVSTKATCQTHTGITEGPFFRAQGWSFSQLGRYIERADQTTRLLDVKYHRLAAASSPASPLEAGEE